MMKVLFATDGSKKDQHARELVAAARWPFGTEIELFGVVRPVGLAVTGDLVDRDLRNFEHELEFLAHSLPQPGCTVRWQIAVGEPAEEIAARARALKADLVVVGNRGRGPLAATVLGSVSAGVIDRAPCPVLVARHTAIDRIVLADDGSVGAGAAAAFLDEWRIFADASLEVVTVVDVGHPLSVTGDPPMAFAGEHPPYMQLIKEERERARETAAARANGLKARPRTIKTSVRVGDAAEEILTAAHDFAADLIVVGSRGQTGAARFFAGSVARRVLLGAKCSVLIARGSIQAERGPDRTDGLGVLTR